MTTKTELNEVEINGVKYVRETAPKPNGNRAVVVLDRGWIYAGDIEERDGRVYLSRVVWLFRWSSVGFDGAIANPGSEKVTIKPHADLNYPADVELFRVPVSDDWGIK
jgi:hypothetical protein